MFPGGASAQTWIERGNEAYSRLRLSEAAGNFEKAVTTDPLSTQARLCLGVVSLFLYQNAVSEAQQKLFEHENAGFSSHEAATSEVDGIGSLIAEQNSTSAKLAEENLHRALQLEPQNQLAMEYLAALYYAWLDPAVDSFGNARRSRLLDARNWYERIFTTFAGHRFGNYVCGVIDWERASLFIRSSESYPDRLSDQEARRSLHTQIAPLLDASKRNLLRAIQIDPADWYPMSYLSLVEGAQAYIANTDEDQRRASGESDEWRSKVSQILAAKALGPSPVQGATATITFDPIAQEAQSTGFRAIFPPDPQYMLPLGIAPPPAFREGHDR